MKFYAVYFGLMACHAITIAGLAILIVDAIRCVP